MKAGKELDALVAEQVMGFVPGLLNRDTGFQYWSTGGGSFAFQPSTDIAAAWKVVAALDYRYVLQLAGPQDGDYQDWEGKPTQLWRAHFAKKWWENTLNPYDYAGAAPSAPHAICLAALKIVGAQ